MFTNSHQHHLQQLVMQRQRSRTVHLCPVIPPMAVLPMALAGTLQDQRGNMFVLILHQHGSFHPSSCRYVLESSNCMMTNSVDCNLWVRHLDKWLSCKDDTSAFTYITVKFDRMHCTQCICQTRPNGQKASAYGGLMSCADAALSLMLC